MQRERNQKNDINDKYKKNWVILIKKMKAQRFEDENKHNTHIIMQTKTRD